MIAFKSKIQYWTHIRVILLTVFLVLLHTNGFLGDGNDMGEDHDEEKRLER